MMQSIKDVVFANVNPWSDTRAEDTKIIEMLVDAQNWIMLESWLQFMRLRDTPEIKACLKMGEL